MSDTTVDRMEQSIDPIEHRLGMGGVGTLVRLHQNCPVATTWVGQPKERQPINWPDVIDRALGVID